MKNWIFWAGVGFLIGGLVSFSINSAVEAVRFEEDLSGYSFTWIAIGVVLMAYALISKLKKT